MQFSIVRLSELESSSRRLDAGYYEASAIEAEKLLKKGDWNYLEELAQSIKSFGAYSLNNAFDYRSGGIPFLRAIDIKNGLIDFSKVLYVDDQANELLWKSQIKPETVLLTMSGTVGESSVATAEMPYPMNSSQDIAKIVTNDLVNPYYLAVFLQSSYGKSQTLRMPIGSVQQHVFLWQINRLVVPLFGREFQSSIESAYKATLSVQQNSDVVYGQAQTLLLSELGLADWQPCHKLSFVRQFSDTRKVRRIDADYFQPKYDDVLAAVKSYRGGWDTMANLTSLKDTNFVPRDDIEYKYIELANITGNGEIADCSTAKGRDLPSRARRKVAAGDVVVSSVEGSLSSIALIDEEHDQALCSTGFHVVTSPSLNSESLLVFMKSMAGQLQLKKGCSGTILAAINKGAFNQIVLPMISEETQYRIKQMVAESSSLRLYSKRLLEGAKRAVEKAIEQDEQTAIAWLDSEGRFH